MVGKTFLSKNIETFTFLTITTQIEYFQKKPTNHIPIFFTSVLFSEAFHGFVIICPI